MVGEPDPPETAGDPSHTTSGGELVTRTQGSTRPVDDPSREDVGAETAPKPSQSTVRQDSARSTEINHDQTPKPPSGVQVTADQSAPAPETRMSNDLPSIASARLSFHRDDNRGRFLPGEIIYDRYVARRKLGVGGMGEVWLVTHRELNVDRALKLIISKVSYDSQARARFRREAQVLARVNHPHAVAVHDARLTDDDVAYIEMEYVPGESLEKVFKTGRPMPLGWVARLVDQLCAVLQAAHDLGIVHRDLKPANLMLLEGRPEGEEFLKVLDFGIAKVLDRNPLESDLRTGTGMFVGTVAYSSPEQLLGNAEARSDLYSVGVIVYEFLTGRRPFLGNPNHILQQALTGTPPPFSVANPDVERFGYPPALEQVVMRCLAKEPDDRPQTARELAALFRDAVKIDAAPPIPDAPTHRLRKLVACVLVVAALLVAGTRLGLFAKTGGGTNSGGGSPPPPPVKNLVPEGFVAAPDAQPDAEGRASLLIPEKLDAATGLRLVFLPGKTFKMGDGDLAHDEAVGDFFLGETEVTNRQMIAYFTARGIAARPQGWVDGFEALKKRRSEAEALDHPAVGIPHDMAEDFARWLGAKLPTQAQWEYAASCGGQPGRRYPWPYPEELRQGMNRANIDTASELDTKTTRVKSYPDDRTPQGIYDLAGNLREWCRDPGAGSDEFAVRGGSWNTTAREYSNQAGMSANKAEDDLGFRIAVEWPGK